MISVVYSIRDRQPERLLNSISSLKQYESKCDVEYIVVDYGSLPEYQCEITEVCTGLGAKLIRSETQGLPWSRAKALNIGAVHSENKYILFTDIDMLFENDVYLACLNKIEIKTMIHCRPLWIPKNGNKRKASLGGYSQMGGLLFIGRNDFLDVSGFNENIEFWGSEDRVLNLKLINRGFKSIWIDSEVKMYHQWHPVSYGMFDIVPDVVKVKQETEVLKCIFDDYSEKTEINIGETITKDRRPILKIIKEGNYKYYRVEINNLQAEIEAIIKESSDNRFIRIDIGDYFPHNENEFGYESRMFWLIKILKKVLFRCGYDVKAQKNNNFNMFMLLKTHLFERGLLDYYITGDYSTIYLLFNKDKEEIN